MKKMKMSLSTLIINIVISALVVVAAALLIVGYAKSDDPIKEYNKLSFILMLMGMVGFAALINVSVLFKKFRMYVLIPILVIYFTLSTIETFFISNTMMGEGVDSLQTSNQALGLAILALFIVSIIFALRNKKWAIIIAIVVLSLGIYNTYSLAVVTKAALGSSESITMLMLYGLGIIQIAQIVYFVSLFYPNVQEEVALEPAVEPVEEPAKEEVIAEAEPAATQE